MMLQASSVLLLLRATFAAQTPRRNASTCAAQDTALAAHGPPPSFDVSIIIPPSLAIAENGCTDSGVRLKCVRTRPEAPSTAAPARLCAVLLLWRGPHALRPGFAFPCTAQHLAPEICFDEVGEYALFAWVESADGAERLSQVTAVSVLRRGAAAVALEAHPRLVADDPRRAFTEFSFSEMMLLRKYSTGARFLSSWKTSYARATLPLPLASQRRGCYCRRRRLRLASRSTGYHAPAL